MRGLQISFANPRFLIIAESLIYTADDLTEEILGGLAEGDLRVVSLEDTLTEVLPDGSTVEIVDVDDIEE